MTKKKASSRKAAKENKAPELSPKEEEDEMALNSLMTEIESDLRDDQIQQIWDKYKAIAFTALAALILGVSGYQYMEQQEADRLAVQASAFARAAEELEAGNTSEALLSLSEVAAQGGNYGALAELRSAAALLDQGEMGRAVEIYRSLVADETLHFAFTDLATILWVLHAMDSENPETLEAALYPLTSPSNAYSYSATELMAVLAAKRGDTGSALSLLQGLLTDNNTPTAVRARAEELSAVYKSNAAFSSDPLLSNDEQ